MAPKLCLSLGAIFSSGTFHSLMMLLRRSAKDRAGLCAENQRGSIQLCVVHADGGVQNGKAVQPKRLQIQPLLVGSGVMQHADGAAIPRIALATSMAFA